MQIREPVFAGWTGFLLLLLAPVSSCQSPAFAQATQAIALPPAKSWPCHTLSATQTWQLNVPGNTRFHASGLLLTKSGELLTVSDRGPTLYTITVADNPAHLVPLTNCFTGSQLARFARQKTGRYDSEGLAQDDQRRVYLCEETDRWILRCDPTTGAVERLGIDWSPVEKYFSPANRNASFEGIAVAQDRLYVANEREEARLIVVDLDTLKVVDDFAVRPRSRAGGLLDYSDLCWLDGALFVLLRQYQVVLKVDPATHQVLAEYDYQAVERDPTAQYYSVVPIGLMEGLAVDRDWIWLVVDNNGLFRAAALSDTRPTLFKCPRPD